ncbi:MAG: ABC transporter permease subunit [Opitutaceae bacterium]
MKGLPGKWSPMGVVALAWVVWSLLGLVYTPYNPQAQDFLDLRLTWWAPGHWFGVDGLGRDMLSRLWRGSGVTVVLGLAASSLTLLLSAILVALERSGPRVFKKLIRGMVSVGIALPVLFVGLLFLVFLEPSPGTLVLAAAVGSVAFGFRQLRVIWAEQAEALHVVASRALGARRGHIIRFSIWPNARLQIVSLAKLFFAVGVLELSGLTFLGLTGDPDLPELGTILRHNQTYLFQQPMLVIWPGLLLSGLLLVVHLSNVQRRV